MFINVKNHELDHASKSTDPLGRLAINTAGVKGAVDTGNSHVEPCLVIIIVSQFRLSNEYLKSDSKRRQGRYKFVRFLFVFEQSCRWRQGTLS